MSVSELLNQQESIMSKEHDLSKMHTPSAIVISAVDEEYYQLYPLIYEYKYYIINTYGISKWASLMQKKAFSELFNNVILIYGNLIFQDLVKLTARNFNIEISEIVRDFSDYLRSINYPLQ